MRERRLAIKRMPGSLWPTLAKMPAQSLQQEAQDIADVFRSASFEEMPAVISPTPSFHEYREFAIFSPT
ncbi:MAG: hypothetical protein KME19_22065 [Microcoleus vaginatus WJT46-NPBG5]|nr:hypothetical protein [Microcoleus vaginatus WJT46-NPBG5]